MNINNNHRYGCLKSKVDHAFKDMKTAIELLKDGNTDTALYWLEFAVKGLEPAVSDLDAHIEYLYAKAEEPINKEQAA